MGEKTFFCFISAEETHLIVVVDCNMARKNKKSDSAGPSAPVISQLPTNPYYPDPQSSSQLLPAPPSYSQSTVPLKSPINNLPTITNPMSANNYAGDSSVNYSRYQNYPNQRSGASVIIQQVPYNHRTEVYNHKVKSFNTNLIITSILAAISSYFAYTLYRDRPCVFNFVVYKRKDVKIELNDVRDSHLSIVSGSAVIVILCLLKSAIGFRGKSHPCFLFPIAVVTFFMTISTLGLAYLAFYTPCAPSVNELMKNLGKTFMASIGADLPTPDRGLFNESNVFMVFNEEPKGVVIFLIDVWNFIVFLFAFLKSIRLC